MNERDIRGEDNKTKRDIKYTHIENTAEGNGLRDVRGLEQKALSRSLSSEDTV